MRKLTYIFLTIIMIFAASCDGKDSFTATSKRPYINIVFPEVSLGDGNYYDGIYEAICTMYEKHKSDDSLLVEASFVPFEKLVEFTDSWRSNHRTRKELLILPEIEQYNILSERMDLKSTPEAEILCLDTDSDKVPVYTRVISMYGATYLAGMATASKGIEKVAIVLGNQVDTQPISGAEGFISGFQAAGGSIDATDIYYLVDEKGYNSNNRGYDMPDSLYRLSYDLNEAGYEFVLPICGSSAMGAYKFSRRFEEDGESAFFTSGIDRDLQQFSYMIIFSIVKSYTRMLEDYIESWLRNEEKPLNMVFGLESGYSYLQISDDYDDYFDKEELERMRIVAIKAEEAYLEKNK